MGRHVTMRCDGGDCVAVEFKKVGGAYRGSVQLRDLSKLRGDPADTLRAAADSYRESLMEIKQWRQEARALRENKTPLPARKAWQLGDILHRLHAQLMLRGCKLQSVYGHLHRHAGLHPKRAAEFATLRRYIDAVEMIPRGTTWRSIAGRVKLNAVAIASRAGDGGPAR